MHQKPGLNKFPIIGRTKVAAHKMLNESFLYRYIYPLLEKAIFFNFPLYPVLIVSLDHFSQYSFNVGCICTTHFHHYVTDNFLALLITLL